jgi:adhesin/invasin
VKEIPVQRFTSAALSILVAFGVMLSLTTAASANPIAGGGYSSSYAGESVFTQNAAGETGQMSAIFFNDGSQAWSPGVVGLLVCAADKVTCNVSANAAFAHNWFSPTVYATVTTTVGAGQNGFFVYDFTVPAGTAPGTVTTFYGDVGLIATGAELRPQGYFQINTAPTPTVTLTLSPTSALVGVGGTQQFTLSGAPSGATVNWSVTGGCGAVTNGGLFAATAMNSASQPCTVVASAGGGTATAAVTVYGPATQLGCSATPSSIVANGGTTGGTANAFITLKDPNGNTVANGTNAITVVNVTPSLATMTPPNGTVNASNGVVTLAVASTLTSGTIQISASSPNLAGCNVQITSGAPGSSAATTTSFTTNPIAADATSTTLLRIDVTDVNGNRNTSDNTTVLTTSRDSGANVCNIVGNPTGTAGAWSSSNGQATVVQGRVEFTVQSTSVPGQCTWTTTTNNTSVAGSSGTLTTQIVGVANRLSINSNNSPHPAASGGTCATTGTNTDASCTLITVGVRDANGSLVTSDSGRAITATFDANSCSGAGGGAPTVRASTATSGGIATFAISSTGAYPGCTITFASSGIQGVNTTAVWTAGGVTHLSCSFSPSPIVSDGSSTSTATVTAADANNNTVTNGSYSINFSRTGGSATTQLTTSPQPTSSGVAYFVVKSQLGISGSDTYTPSIASGTALPATSCQVSVN